MDKNVETLTNDELYQEFWRAAQGEDSEWFALIFAELRRRKLPDPQPDED